MRRGGHAWGLPVLPGWRGIKRAIGLTGSPGEEHQTRRAIAVDEEVDEWMHMVDEEVEE